MANPPTSPPGHSRSHSRSPSAHQRNHSHVPTTPSGLRNYQLYDSIEDDDDTTPPTVQRAPTSKDKSTTTGTSTPSSDETAQPGIRTRLLDQQQNGSSSSYGATNNRPGRPKSPRPPSFRTFTSYDSVNSTLNFAARHLPRVLTGRSDDPLMQQEMDMTAVLAKQHGIKSRRMMYFLYYFPFANWIQQYKWTYIKGDLVAAFTMASFYLPMALSYASNLGHIPPINGLYSFAFNPFIYALFGTCSRMVVGPEAAGSLLLGQVVRENTSHGKHHDLDGYKNAQIAGMVTGLSGAVILIAGLCRLGFLDGVLSRPFLRGFISAIGIVILVDQLIPEMGLDELASQAGGAAHGSSLDKIIFLCKNFRHAHGLTCAVGFGSFAVVMICREIKRRLDSRAPWVAYVPDRFLVVVLSAVLTWACHWQEKGLDILGDIKGEGRPFRVEFPFQPTMLEHATDAFGTAILIALLGFFESSVAAKSLGNSPTKKGDEADGISNMIVSPNRELVALGVANIAGGLFMALPAFGGYGRSKVNASTGGKTPMSSIFLSLISVVCILFLLPYFYYIPKCVLSAMISVVAYSLIEEAPHDVLFFWKISGYTDLVLMLLIFLTTFFWNLRIGIFVGIALSLLRILRHSTRPRIQILGRVPGSKHFENAEMHPLLRDETREGLEFIENTLIIKIPEPLTFANTGSLNTRLKRLEDHGMGSAHPALPRLRRSDKDQVVIFDVHGVTGLDPAAAQVLLDIVTGYRDRGVRIFFCRVAARRTEVWRLMRVSGIVDAVGGEAQFVDSVQEALDTAELETGHALLPEEHREGDDVESGVAAGGQ